MPQKLKDTKKITLATLKAFAKRNAKKLFVRGDSDFSGMSDMVEFDRNAKFKPTTFEPDNDGYYTTGIQGVYTVGGSRNSLSLFDEDGFFGIRVYNCCGSSVLAIKNEKA